MSEPSAQPHPESASYTPAYRTYILVVLLLTYVVNVMDRGVLALLLESIRKEFELTDGQLGFLSSLPFAHLLFDARHSHRRPRGPHGPSQRAGCLLSRCGAWRPRRAAWRSISHR